MFWQPPHTMSVILNDLLGICEHQQLWFTNRTWCHLSNEAAFYCLSVEVCLVVLLNADPIMLLSFHVETILCLNTEAYSFVIHLCSTEGWGPVEPGLGRETRAELWWKQSSGNSAERQISSFVRTTSTVWINLLSVFLSQLETKLN